MKRLFPVLCLLCCLLAVSKAFALPPAAPSNAGATVLSRTELQISWQDNSNDEVGFQVFTYANGRVGSFLGTAAANSTSATIINLTGGQSVQYAIFAVNLQNESSGGIVTSPVTMPDVLTRFGHEATVGVPFSAELYTDAFDLQSTAQVTGLPAGASFDPATRTFAFTPAEPGNFSLDVQVSYSDGFAINATVPIRILPAASGPVAALSLPGVAANPNGAAATIDLNSYFTDPDCSRAVRMTYGLGVVDVILYEAATPATVANFLAYVNGSGQGAYDGAIIHRSIPGFVLQGGGYRPIGGSAFESVTDLAPVVNEPGLENVRGTLSMAKVGGDPNSATNEWFVSLADNRENLNFQNGGFSVFGRVAGDGMTVVDRIAALPRGNYNSITVDGSVRTGLLSDCPMDAATAPVAINQDKLVQILSAAEVAPLAFAIISNSDPAVAAANIVDGVLTVMPLTAGTSTVRVRVADLDNNVIERDVSVEVVWTFADWVAASAVTLENNPLDDPDGDQFSNFLEYALFGDPESPEASLVAQRQVSFGTPSALDYLAVAFSTRRGIDDAVVYVEAISDLNNSSTGPGWTEVWNSSEGAAAVTVDSNTVGSDHVDWVIRDVQAIDASPQRFMRVRVADD